MNNQGNNKKFREIKIDISNSEIGSAYTEGDVNINFNGNYDLDINYELKEILKNLNKKYPELSESEKKSILQKSIKENCNKNSKFKRKLLSALKSGSAETLKILADNPFISISIETIKGWIESS